MQLTDLFELNAQAMPQRTFGSQLIQQRLGFFERVGRHILAFEQIAETSLHLRFSKQVTLLTRTQNSAADCLPRFRLSF